MNRVRPGGWLRRHPKTLIAGIVLIFFVVGVVVLAVENEHREEQREQKAAKAAVVEERQARRREGQERKTEAQEEARRLRERPRREAEEAAAKRREAEEERRRQEQRSKENEEIKAINTLRLANKRGIVPQLLVMNLARGAQECDATEGFKAKIEAEGGHPDQNWRQKCESEEREVKALERALKKYEARTPREIGEELAKEREEG